MSHPLQKYPMQSYRPTFQNAPRGFTCKIDPIVLQNHQVDLQIYFNIVFWLRHTLTSL